MSLASLALRLITRRALEGRTLAATRVRDSELLPLGALVDDADGGGGTQPFISLYVDQTGGDVLSRGWNSASLTTHLLFEIAIASPTQVQAADGTDAEIPESSAGLEASLDLIAYQIKAALIGDGSPWSDLWSRLVMKITTVETFRGAEFRKTGVRFAARQIDLGLELVDDPVPGAAPEGLWADILAAFAADAELDDLAKALAAVIGGNSLPSWRLDAFDLGYSVADMQAIGDAPLDGFAMLDVVPMTEATVLDAAPGTLDPTLVIDPADSDPDL